MSVNQQMIMLAALVFSGSATLLFAGATTQPSGDGFCATKAIFMQDDHDDDEKQKSTSLQNSNEGSGRYFFNLLDNRSSYGNDFFHDPLMGPDFDSERQIEMDYAHGENHGMQDDEADAEFQWNVVGELTVAGEFGWDSEHQGITDGGDDGDDVEQGDASGFENVDLAIYHPLFQYVSKDKFLDYTAVVRLDVGIPTHTPVSGTDFQIIPYVGHLLRIGDHVSIEAWTGSQFTVGPDQTSQLIYGVSLGYIIPHDQLPVAWTESITPIFELDGQAPFSGNGEDALFGVGGFDISFNSLGELQPHIEIGYQFPIDQGGRDELRWGVVAQIFLEF